jgi:hypothetical protein
MMVEKFTKNNYLDKYVSNQNLVKISEKSKWIIWNYVK